MPGTRKPTVPTIAGGKNASDYVTYQQLVDVIRKYCGGGTDDQEEGGCHVVQNCGCKDDCEKRCICVPAKDVVTFEVYMRRCRVVKNDLFDAGAELMLTGYAGGQSAVFPGMGCWFFIHKKWDWRTINKLVARFDVEKGTKRAIPVMADAIEADRGGGGNWEMGSGTNLPTLILEPGVQTGAEVVSVECKRVKLFPGNVTAVIEVEFVAVQVTA